MGSKKIRLGELPGDAILEAWGDNTAWIVFDEPQQRMPLRGFLDLRDASVDMGTQFLSSDGGRTWEGWVDGRMVAVGPDRALVEAAWKWHSHEAAQDE